MYNSALGLQCNDFFNNIEILFLLSLYHQSINHIFVILFVLIILSLSLTHTLSTTADNYQNEDHDCVSMRHLELDDRYWFFLECNFTTASICKRPQEVVATQAPPYFFTTTNVPATTTTIPGTTRTIDAMILIELLLFPNNGKN